MTTEQREQFVAQAQNAGFTEEQAEFMADFLAGRYHTHKQCDIFLDED